MIEHFTDPYPDEILYSVWARYSDQVQYPRKHDVFRELLGGSARSPVVEFPRYLGYFVDHLPFGHHYTVDWFIDHHTLLPFYSSFMPPERLTCVREIMINGGASNALHRKVGVIIHKTASPHWLRYCPECVEHDRNFFGECYWHRLHQVLGVEICPLHKTFLENSTVPTRRPHEARKFISAEQTIQAISPRKAVSSPFYNILMNIALATRYLLSNRQGRTDPDFLRMQYHSLLLQRGFIARDGQIRVCDFLIAFTDYYPSELLRLLHSELQQIRFPGESWPSLIFLSRGAQHPLRHLLVLHFLGCSVEEFFHQHFQPQKPFGEGPWPCLNPACEYYLQRNITSYQLKERTDRPVGRFACECGFTYTRTGPDQSPEDIFRRESILSYGPHWEMKLSEYWADLTVSRKDILSRLGINPNTLRWLVIKLQLPIPRNPSRVKTSKEPKQYSLETISRYREQWLDLIEGAPGESRTFLQRKRPDLYRWLSLHDKEWFMTHSPSRKTRQKPIARKVQLRSLGEVVVFEVKESLDIRTADAVYATARQLMTISDPLEIVSFKAIFKNVPQVISVKRRPKDYPRTVQDLQEVKETRKAFSLRKIQLTLQKYQEERICPTLWQFVQRAHLAKNTPRSEIIQQALDEAMGVLSQFA